MPDEQERGYMAAAIDAARKSRSEEGKTSPKVGVVVVRGEQVATAHRGETDLRRHAEFEALEVQLKEVEVAGAIVYTTLEPCTARGPEKVPCADRLADRKVRKVVIGMLDPNPRICGRGVLRLRSAGVSVELFLVDLQPVVEELNRDFVRVVQKAAGENPLQKTLAPRQCWMS